VWLPSALTFFGCLRSALQVLKPAAIALAVEMLLEALHLHAATPSVFFFSKKKFQKKGYLHIATPPLPPRLTNASHCQLLVISISSAREELLAQKPVPGREGERSGGRLDAGAREEGEGEGEERERKRERQRKIKRKGRAKQKTWCKSGISSQQRRHPPGLRSS
jgi:hypothetical protein